MKTRFKRSMILLALLMPLVFDSCLPEPAVPSPTILNKMNSLVGTVGEDGKLIQQGGTPCPAPGTDCDVITPTHVTQTRANLVMALDQFKFYLDNNNLGSYFSDPHNYELFFSDKSNPDAAAIRKKLVDGTYSARFLSDRTIAVFEGNTLDDEHLIFTVFVNLDNV